MPSGAKAAHTRIQGLDVLRGGAILLVLLRHAFPDTFGGAGIVGVVAFFALSGYLITAILYGDLTTYGRVRYGRFYRNRALRLIPALVLLVVGIVVVTVAFDPLHDVARLPRTVLVALTYTANLPFADGGAAIGHLWTLATEEQFYLVWPILLAIAVRWRRLRLLVIVAGVGIWLACVASLILVSPDYARIYTLPSSWAVAMVIGAAGYFGRDRVAGWIRVGSRRAAWACSVALVALVVMALVPDLKSSFLAYVVAGPLIAVCTLVLINSVRHWRTVRGPLLRPLLGLGMISYAAYLWDYPLSLWLEPLGFWAHGIGSIVLTVVAATISLHLVERPAQRLKGRWERRSTASETRLVVEALDGAEPAAPAAPVPDAVSRR